MQTTEPRFERVRNLAQRAVGDSRWIRSKRGVAIVLAAITLFGLGLRLWHLDTEPLHVDELRQVTEVQGPLLDVIHRSYVIAQPPLDYIVGWATVQIGPATDFTQRLPAAIFGTVSVLLVGLVLFRAGQAVAGYFAAFFVAISPLLVALSQYARPYALPVFTVLLTLALYQHWHLGSKTWPVLAWFTFAAALALLSRPTMPLIALGSLGLIALVKALSAVGYRNPVTLIRSDPPALLVLPSVFLLVWVPSASYLNSGFLVDCWRCDQWERLATGVQNLGDFAELALSPNTFTSMLVLAIVVLVFPAVRSALAATWFLWAPLLITAPAFALVQALVLPPGTFFAIRYLVFLPIGLIVFLAISLAALVGAARGSALLLRFGLVLLISLMVVGNASAMLSRVKAQAEGLDLADWRSTAEYIESIETGGDVIISIDTRPFSRDFKFGFEASPRYYHGNSPFFQPEQVAVDPVIILDATRFHFVLFVPKMAGDWTVPSGWEVQDFSEMKIITTPRLATAADRVEAWWTLAATLRPDVAVTTLIAGGAIADEVGLRDHPWFELARDEAIMLGEEGLARELIDAASS